MDTEEKNRLRREVLDDVGALLFEHLAAQEWGRVLVEMTEGDAGQPGPARKRQPDQDRHHRRVDDQERRQHRGAAQDAKVLGQHPADRRHQWPRPRRNSTNAVSRSPSPLPPSSPGGPR